MNGTTSTERIAIVSSGAVTSVGLTAASTCAAIRASLDNFQETHFVDDVGDPLLGARVLDEDLGLDETEPGFILGGAGKLAAMFVRAATECVQQIGGIDATSTALLLIGPDGATRPGMGHAQLQACFEACGQAIGRPFHEASRISQLGGPGFVAALRYGQRLLRERRVRHVLVTGLDSLLNGDDINQGLAARRLLTARQADGFIPGEAAACVLLAPTGTWGAAGADSGMPVLELAGIGWAQETENWLSGRATTGKGLAAAIRAAFAQAGLHPHDIHQRLSDGSGESFFMDEAIYAWGRVLRALNPPGYMAPLVAASVGDTGSAAGPLLATVALDMARKGWGAGPYTLLHFSSISEPRAAAVLQATG